MHRLLEVFRLRPDYGKRVFGLDLMRALAIIFVVMGHGWMLDKANTGFPWIRLIDGVELFFVLSGFLIGTILIRTFQESPELNLKTLGTFWVRRWFRTLPTYYLILLVNILFVGLGIINEDASKISWRFFLFLQNFSQGFTGFFWESWSLAIEEWFYLTFPLILAGLFLLLRNSRLGKRYIFLSAIGIYLATPLLLRATIASHFDVDQFWGGVRIQKVVIFRLDGIAMGLLAAYIKYWHPKAWAKVANIAFVAGIALDYLILYSDWPPNDFATKVYRASLQSFACALLLPKFDGIRKAPPIVTKVFTHISLISYSMYLINLALVSEVIRDNFPPTGPVSAWLSYILYWTVTITVSTLLYKFYEKPMTGLRDGLGRKLPAATTPAGTDNR